MSRAWMVMIAVGLWACGGAPSGKCVPGQTAACACSGGQMGVQSCQPDDTYAACDCGDTSSHSSSSNPSSPNGPPAGAKRVFVTSGTYDGDLGGLAGADQLCQQVADGASLGGTWKAWLSDGVTAAIDRISDAGPWYRIDGRVAFENHDSLASTAANPINLDERGEQLQDIGESTNDVWTGTGTGGRRSDDICSGWTASDLDYDGTLGSWGSGAAWTDSSAFASCDQRHRLYCFEQ